MKLHGERIHVRLDAEGNVTAIQWRLKFLRVISVEDVWAWRSEWWVTPELKGKRRTYFRVACQGHRGTQVTLDIYYEGETERWVLSRELD
jgi:hypothetical protein